MIFICESEACAMKKEERGGFGDNSRCRGSGKGEPGERWGGGGRGSEAGAYRQGGSPEGLGGLGLILRAVGATRRQTRGGPDLGWREEHRNCRLGSRWGPCSEAGAGDQFGDCAGRG